MEIESIISGLNDFGKLVEDIKSTRIVNYGAIKKELSPKEHAVVTDLAKRPDKTITVTEGEGEGARTVSKTVKVARLPVPIQKQIVLRAATFLCGNPIELIASTEENTPESRLMEILTKTWDDNKLDYESKRLAKLMMSETECAELWYSVPAEENYWKDTVNQGKAKARLRFRVLANKYGDTLYPVFNQFNDMIAFARGWETKNAKNETVQHFDLYTEKTNYLGIKDGNAGWTFKPETNPHGKIPVIYYAQEQTEWEDVQYCIDRLETLISNHADTNDYYGSPMVKVRGKVEGFSSKGESGKVLEMDKDADAEYLTWDQSPESVKMEYNNLRSLIMDLTDTPDMSFERMAQIGGNLTNFGVKMMFLSAHMKAADKEETFGKGIQRRLNFLKAALAVVNTEFEQAQQLTIKPRFNYYLPKNEKEAIDILSTATSGETPLMSQETAIELNPMIEDKQAEKDRLKNEKEGDQKSPAKLNSLMNSDAA